MDKKEILDILDNAKDERGAVPMRLVRQAFDKLVQPEERTDKRTETHACDLIRRKTGIWLTYTNIPQYMLCKCSACGADILVPYLGKNTIFNYCPNCGAKMEGDLT